ncbi:MAG: phosphodiester glycosidase family protein [Gemmatimonadetes bacterium]|nr:phosphodiester glycosidase family protein [Gemmatimonadota bacterium]
MDARGLGRDARLAGRRGRRRGGRRRADRRELRAAEALNLDRGGSSALVVRGVVVSHPSDRQGERAVGNALALAGCGG